MSTEKNGLFSCTLPCSQTRSAFSEAKEVVFRGLCHNANCRKLGTTSSSKERGPSNLDSETLPHLLQPRFAVISVCRPCLQPWSWKWSHRNANMPSFKRGHELSGAPEVRCKRSLTLAEKCALSEGALQVEVQPSVSQPRGLLSAVCFLYVFVSMSQEEREEEQVSPLFSLDFACLASRIQICNCSAKDGVWFSVSGPAGPIILV